MRYRVTRQGSTYTIKADLTGPELAAWLGICNHLVERGDQVRFHVETLPEEAGWPPAGEGPSTTDLWGPPE